MSQRDTAADGGSAGVNSASPATRESLRALSRRRYADVDLTVDGKATRFRFQSLTSAELRSLRVWVAESEGNVFRVWEALICKCLVDESGSRIYQDSEVDADVFAGFDGALIEQLGIAADEHAGYTSDVWSIEKLEGAVKNLNGDH